MSSGLTLTDVVKQMIANQVAGIHTFLPAKVISYDANECKADVQPVIKQVYTDDTTLDMPVINDAPVIWPRVGNASLTMPLAEGDKVAVFFSERSIDKWIAEGSEDAPDDPRKFDLSDGVVIPGLFPFSEPLGDPGGSSVTLAFGEGKIAINDNTKIAIGNSAAELMDLVDQLITALNLSVTNTSIGPQPLSKAADGTFAAILTDLGKIKGSLP